MKAIIEKCLELDRLAVLVYSSLYDSAADPRLREIWDQMRKDEQIHVSYWKHLLELADNGMVPMLFDDRDKIIDDLTSIEKKAAAMYQKYKASSADIDSIVLAYRLEFYLLYPVLERLFNFMAPSFDGAPRPAVDYEMHVRTFTDKVRPFIQDNPPLLLLDEAINAMRERNSELVRESTMDKLTGVFNRKSFFNTVVPLAYLAQRNRYMVGVAMVDIDNFKFINDTHGHQKGDKVLETAGRAFMKHTRASDIVGRYGGDEFIFFFPEIDRKSVIEIMGKIHTAAKEKMPVGIEVSLSIGIACKEIDTPVEKQLMDLINKADHNLYYAKKLGKNRIYMDG
ncbi:MAG: hypothetical protein A2268_01380 [Candidatus Raymondbacteria bacterium RifOxyA12_full_50_37]|uniref:GGDEF domain-containing protein n=1 Tax=Candidatus Raymondbacteria bacterium RIFOXYD12_FULL_49_13 TaxID=1817890 RepID=A0A1F7FJG4_UNCRA|nr:MAG: hypothetical protein A2268_01380 [Candidatus Raymondbacteria bacterium RifOxyA12_full_50_37]OGJ87958.1 MAG: hypothetical protein A2248_01955 [Candidatus Raymondbacteria bacterium RIFOXYA2_FULL_49_16]OGJ88011.1 MAG: hypothetical protein A2350_00930 [Candidatus Raymondbacteria bacterium RifOxyB12_full_50_8]OGJ95615.1 MAG: hypothetical protein A2453_13075 [Candidatus Raymondbacteria bacterium RIFOXYC2_FULL_50_21]OGK06758.1 MAG: hypothetical protein A2519_05010 [Candidatus Raymondbacteria b